MPPSVRVRASSVWQAYCINSINSVTSARAVRRSLQSAICRLPAAARSSWSSEHPPYVTTQMFAFCTDAMVTALSGDDAAAVQWVAMAEAEGGTISFNSPEQRVCRAAPS